MATTGWVIVAAVALCAPEPDPVRIYRPGETATTKAIELRVEGVTTAREIGGRQARAGYEFVLVDTLWKNIIPLTPDGKPTKYVVSMLRRQAWLLSDDRYGETLDPVAQQATPGHLPIDGFTIAKFDDTVRGTLVFEAPAAKSRVFQYYDRGYGHVAFTLTGPVPAAAPPALGAARSNALLRLSLTEAGAHQAADDPPGLRTYVVGVRGASLSADDIIDLPSQPFVFLMNEHGCVAQPRRNAPGLARPFGDVSAFPPTGANEGQLSFLMPDGSRSLKLLVRPATGGPIDLPAGEDFAPKWPTPAHTFEDGSTMKVHVLPRPARPASLAAGIAERQVLVDVAVENLSKARGIEFQPVQLRLAMPDGRFVDPSAASSTVPCRLDADGLVPAGGVRRFLLVYDVAGEGVPRIHFRGFELNEAMADLP